jgi:hypothetical protein
MRVVGGGQPRTDVQELTHTGFGGQVAHRTDEERTAETGILRKLRLTNQNLIADRAIGGEVVLAAQQIVPDPRGVRDRGVQLGCLLLIVRHVRVFLLGWTDADGSAPA